MTRFQGKGNIILKQAAMTESHANGGSIVAPYYIPTCP